jgi:YVTN family beta-propeller protein
MKSRFNTAVRLFVTAWILVIPCTQVFAAGVGSPALLVLNKSGAELEIIDPASNKIVGHIPTGEGPHEVATDGKIAIVCNYGAQVPGSTLSIIDLASQKELKRLPLPVQRPHGIQISGGKAYFTAEMNKLVARYDIASGALDWFMGTGQEITHMLVLNKDASAIYTANILSDSVSALQKGEGSRPWRATHIKVGSGPEGIDLSPDGKQLWAAHSRDGGVSIIDTSTNKVTETIPGLTKRSNRLKFTPDGKRVLISDPEGQQVVVLDASTHKVLQRIDIPGFPLGILIPPDGKRAYIAVNEGGKLAILDLTTMKVAGEISVGGAPDGMAWVE